MPETGVEVPLRVEMYRLRQCTTRRGARPAGPGRCRGLIGQPRRLPQHRFEVLDQRTPRHRRIRQDEEHAPGFSWCREPYPLQVLAGLESVFRSVANVAVSGAEEVAGCLRNFAALITLGPPDGTCPTGTAQCRSFFISKLTQFNSADEKAWENQSVSKMTTAWTSRPNANILQNYASYAALPLTIRNAFPATEFALLQSGKPSVWADNACPPALVNSPCQIGPIA